MNALEADHSVGFSRNLSLTGRFREVPWHHLMTHPDYDDIVDIYEGGYFHGRGVYRSEYNSCMNNNVAYYSTWCRQLIVQRIMKLAGEIFSLESFLAKDRRNMGTVYRSATRTDNSAASTMHGRPPVIMDRSVLDKYIKSGKSKVRRR